MLCLPGPQLQMTASGNGVAKEDEIRFVRLPAGWEGLSIKLRSDGRLIVAEVPKACFSSQAFASSGALKPQVEGVHEGDEIVTLNGEAAARVETRVTTAGDSWNACSSMSPPHAVGSKGKFDSPPCVACDFIRRKKALGLDVAIQMWLRAVKRDIQFTLGVRACSSVPEVDSSLVKAAAGSHTNRKKVDGQSEPSAVVDLAAGSALGGVLSKLKSLDDLTKERQKSKLSVFQGSLKEYTGKAAGKGKGKGKSKGKGKVQGKRPSGPDLPRTRLSQEPVTGEVLEWKGKYGWIRSSQPIDHPKAQLRQGKLYIHVQDLLNAPEIAAGEKCRFHLYEDASGLGVEECYVLGSDGRVVGGEDSSPSRRVIWSSEWSPGAAEWPYPVDWTAAAWSMEGYQEDFSTETWEMWPQGEGEESWTADMEEEEEGWDVDDATGLGWSEDAGPFSEGVEEV